MLCWLHVKSRLTTGMLDGAPSWRYNDKILYHDRGIGSTTIYTMNPDGSEKTALTEGLYPSWSVDANKILFSWMGDIWTMNPDGSNKMLLYDESSGPWAFEPACSPKGNKVAFSIGGTICTTSIPPWCEHFSDLYMMNSDGSNLERFTFDNGDWCYDPQPPWPIPLNPKPTWFTDGTKIAYHYKGDIWVMSGFPALSADLYTDGIVNLLDFGVLADCWRQDDPLADIAPDGGDDIVDFMDLAKLCEEWLQKEEWYQP
jgi:Tol biopolymer transport system component